MPEVKSIRTHNLRVQDLKDLKQFYCESLGMLTLHETLDHVAFGYPFRGCNLAFRKANVLRFAAQPNDFYWKIGITLRDLDKAIAFLRDNGENVPDPVQFRDIGYMSKIIDPNGFIIELLQQGFEGNAQSVPEGHPIGGQAILAHITLRVTDISSAQSYFGDTLGMRLMSVQPVEEHGFCLYFYSWSNEVLPDPDLESVKNREWLWARPYTFIELQHLYSTGVAVRKTDSASSGFDGFSYSNLNADKLIPITANDLVNLR